MKRILSIIIIILCFLLIYIGSKPSKKRFFVISDFVFNEHYDLVSKKIVNLDKVIISSSKNLRSIDVINNVNNNAIIDNKTFQYQLIKSDIILLSVGMNDIFSNVDISDLYNLNNMYGKFNEVFTDLEKMLKLLRIYSKEQIIFIGYYSKDDKLNEYMNNKLLHLCKKYNVDYIKTSDIVKKNTSEESINLISNVIIDKINKK